MTTDDVALTPESCWKALSYENRELIARHIFDQITTLPSCSFRRLIYDRLGFEGRSYECLYLAGGMLITNAMHQTAEEQGLYDAEG